MKNIFQDILSRKSVEGVIFLSNKGTILFMDISSLDTASETFQLPDPDSIILIMKNIKKEKEIELFFENRNIYLRFIKNGTVMIILSKNSNSSVIRLIVESIISQIEQFKEPKGLKKLFKRKN
jgi:hypothetical protein